MVLMYWLQTEAEQQARDTKDRNRAGFMSSHAWHGTRIAEQLIAGESLSEEDVARVREIAPRYSKQVTRQLIRAALADNPRLAAYAVTFGVR